MIRVLAVENYRSLRGLTLPLEQLNVVTGANGSGKSNLYRALRLLADAARNGAVSALAREGGLPSTLWAGPTTIGRAVREGRYPVQGTVSKGPVGLRLGFAADDFGYAIDFGLPIPGETQFNFDPEIKCEAVWAGPLLRPATLLVDRNGPLVLIRDRGGEWFRVPYGLQPFDSMLAVMADPERAPDLIVMRERIRSWRFYDHLRTDAHAPARSAQIGTRTPVLSHDGADVAAALQTIIEIGNVEALNKAVDNAFPGSTVEIRNSDGRFELTLRQHGLLRPLGSAELSDGTLRYLLWVAALLTPRPPELLVLNEPETSLHPDLLDPLAELIAAASANTQIIVVTHAAALATALRKRSASMIELEKEFGVTTIVDQAPLEEPPWRWPKR